jgi:quercetin dioxygenase-like cupin family protein
MKHASRILVVLLAAPLLMLAPAASAQDSVAVAPQFHKVLLENDKVRVLEVTLKPGDKIPMHAHPGGYVAYSVSGSKARFTGADGKPVDRDMKTGEAIWSDPVTHIAENVGTTTTKVIVVELKAK